MLNIKIFAFFTSLILYILWDCVCSLYENRMTLRRNCRLKNEKYFIIDKKQKDRYK